MVAAIVCFGVASVLVGLGNTVGYHRLLTHRGFTCGRGVRWTFTFLGALFSGSPVVWVGLHRLHHARSDTDEDPHSPIKGAFWAHSGWMINSQNPVLATLFALSGFGQQAVLLKHDIMRLLGRNPPTWRSVCRDLMADPFMRFLDTPLVMPLLFAAQVFVATFFFGWPGLVWLWALHLVMTNSSWAVNSICHLERFGARTHETREGSRNVWWLSAVTLGESYHNNHHRYPRSAKHALDGGLDLSWVVIRGLVALNLASDPWLPKIRKPKPKPEAAAATAPSPVGPSPEASPTHPA